MERRKFLQAAMATAAATAAGSLARRLSAGPEMEWAAAISPQGSPAQVPGSNVGFDRRSLFIDGRRRILFGASLHYFRAPDAGLWRDRIASLKALGYNAIDTYYYWAFHSPGPGRYDFSGTRDLDRFHDLVEEAGMFLVARPGPYICAEVDAGGFPGWLLAKKGILLRCRQAGRPRFDPDYFQYVKEWFQEVIPRIVSRPNLVLLQIENEYNTMTMPNPLLFQLAKLLTAGAGLDAVNQLASRPGVRWAMIAASRQAAQKEGYLASCEYMRELYKLSRELGVKVPIMHNDFSLPRQRWTDVDLLGVDDYPIMSPDWRERAPVGGRGGVV
jgi:hypothetical protein